MRLVEGLVELFDLEVISRQIPGGVEVNRTPRVAVRFDVGPAARTKFAFWLVRQLVTRHARFDLIVVQGYSIASLGCNVVGRLFRRPVAMLVCSPAELYYRCRKGAPGLADHYRLHKDLGLRVLARLNSWLGQRYFVLGRHLSDVVRSHGFARPVEITPVYGVDSRVYRPSSRDRHALRVELGLPTKGSIILFSSRIAPEKDTETLLRAVKVLWNEGVELLVVNRSGGFRELEALSAEIGIRQLVNASGPLNPLNELATLYQASTVCVQASREEGLGFSPLEALACGTPVIAASVGGLQETIVDGETGWTYPRGDVNGLASALRAVLANPNEANRRTARGQAMVLERYERAKVFGAFQEAVERAIVRTGIQ